MKTICRIGVHLLVTFVYCSIGQSEIIAQNNLLPNPGFEEGSTSSDQHCNGYDDKNKFNKDVDGWDVAEHSRHGGEGRPSLFRLSDSDTDPTCTEIYNQSYCASLNRFAFPQAADYTSDRFVVIESFPSPSLDKLFHTHEAIIASLREGALEPDATYVLRFKFLPRISNIFTEILSASSNRIDNVNSPLLGLGRISKFLAI